MNDDQYSWLEDDDDCRCCCCRRRSRPTKRLHRSERIAVLSTLLFTPLWIYFVATHGPTAVAVLRDLL